MVGSTISHYRIVSKIGAGGMGVVYKAEDTRLQRTVALKFLAPHEIESRHKHRFLEEARNAARLHHPNICPIYEVDEVDDQLFFAMAYLEGETLSHKIGERGFDIDSALEIAIQIADGLEEAHRQGIIHRDIKSSNIIVNSQGHAYILDFGLSLRTGTQRVTLEGGRVGTPAFMSPEQALGTEVDARTDIWSLGVILFQMLTGQLPFGREHTLALVHAIINDPVPSVQTLRADVPTDVQKAVERALAKDPTLRWQSARDMAADLRRVRGKLGADATRSMILPEAKPPRWSRRSVLTAAIGAPALVVAAYYASQLLPPALPKQKHIAVLPFQVIGPDVDLVAITNGLVEVLTAKLSELDVPGELLVVPASEIRSRNISSAQDAKRIYGANLVISGSVQLLRQLVQFTVTLVDPNQMRQLGARAFSSDVQDTIALRDNVLSNALSLLQVQLSQETRIKSGRADTAFPAAYTDYLKGEGYLARYGTPGNIERAVSSFQSALRKDPNYAQAYSGLAGAYRWKAIQTGDKQWSELAIQDAERAAHIEPQLTATHAKLGEIYGVFGREHEAIQEFQRAMQLSPGNGEVYRDLARVLENLGRYTEAEAMYQDSIEKRPRDWYGHLLLALFFQRQNRYSEAETQFRQAIELTPDNPIACRTLAALYRIEGRYSEAVAQLQKALQIEPTASLYSALGVTYFFQHRFGEAAAAIEKALDMESGRYIFWGNLGMVYEQMPGKTNDTQHALQRALELGRKYTETAPKDYNAHANLAEYHARLGQFAESAAELGMIPAAVRTPYLLHFTLVYELMGQRQKAIQSLLELPKGTPLNEIKNDPALRRLWADEGLQAKLRQKENVSR